MSALKNFTHIAQATAPNSGQGNQPVTNISVHARVDYTLRFSTPAVYVLGENPQAYSHVASHYIESLDSDRNIAFIACASQLNNIQMRCRIIEQLFGEQLFDPEEPLSVSIINLMKKQSQPLSIVLEHSQFLSLQVTHEVCQLAQIAKKRELDIQVLLVGNPETGYLMADNALLFKDKVAIVQANNAQLINLQSKVLKRPSTFFSIPKGVKVFALFTLLSGILLAGVYSLWQMDVVNFSSLPSKPVTQIADTSEKMVTSQAKEAQVNEPSNQKLMTLATASDVLNALHGNTEQVASVEIEQATPNDVLMAITTELQTPQVTPVQNTELTVREVVEPTVNESPKWPEHQIFKGTESGFVIQFGGFTKEAVKANFLARYRITDYLTYQRVLAQGVMQVITSPVFETREQAQDALDKLPTDLKERGIWVKNISAIKVEISAFESSHL
ncbi:hypothetical protein LP316_04485 [Thalassotalea sp. LPB0316]|uniref:SPOR domain-containing protein n=1 Tax=Thalassotalea sp. LPB0316 TaxID=2769490 RepID=UPI0018679D46|nr:hypothetical protein [Thalassotalea sp. LPB0316]QOL26563.1 hypothetical protein LP316_04485 [Thalassotalea sp. LPB0316]